MPRVIKGKASFHSDSDAIKRVRAKKMLAARVEGQTLDTIGKQFACSPDTVRRLLDWAERAGIVAEAEDRILEELVPLAINAFQSALKKGDTFVADRVLAGTGILKKQAERSRLEDPNGPDEMTLEVFLLRRKERRNAPTDQASLPADGRVLDATLLPAPETPAASLPPAGLSELPLDLRQGAPAQEPAGAEPAHPSVE